jgi:hypothetical protein
MADVNNGPKADGSQLRERPSAKPLHLDNSANAKQKVLELNREEEDNKNEEQRKTFGRTPDGTGKWADKTFRSKASNGNLCISHYEAGWH